MNHDLPRLEDDRIDIQGLRAKEILLPLYGLGYDGLYCTHNIVSRTLHYEQLNDPKPKDDISKRPMPIEGVKWNAPKTKEQVSNWQKSYGSSGVGLLAGRSNLAPTYLGFIDADTDNSNLASALRNTLSTMLGSMGALVIRRGKRDENGKAHRFTIAFLSDEPIVTSKYIIQNADRQCNEVQILGMSPKTGTGVGCVAFDHYGRSNYEYSYDHWSFLDVARKDLPNVNNWSNLNAIIDKALQVMPEGWTVTSSTLRKNNSGRPYSNTVTYSPINDSDTLLLSDAGPRWHPGNLPLDDVREILSEADPVNREAWLQTCFKLHDYCEGKEWGFELLVEHSIVEDTNPYDGSTCDNPTAKNYRRRYSSRDLVEPGVADVWKSCAAPRSEGNLTFGEDVKRLNALRKPKRSQTLLTAFSSRLDNAIEQQSIELFDEIATDIRNDRDLQDHHRGQLVTKYVKCVTESGLEQIQRTDVKSLLTPDKTKNAGVTDTLVNKYNRNCWNDQNGIPHVSTESNGKKRSIPTYSQDLIEVFSVEVFKATGKVPTSSELKNAAVALAGFAKYAPSRTIHNRSASADSGDIIIDKGNCDGGVYRINKEQGLVNTFLEEHEFRFKKSMKPYPDIDDIPISDLDEAIDDINFLDKYLTTTPEHNTLIYTGIIQILIPDTPNVGMQFIGEHGSGKTSVAKFVKQIIDPTSNPKTIMPKNNEDLALLLHTEKFPLIDDYTAKIPHRTQSTLNAAITLSSTKMRSLYTTSELAEVALDAGISLTTLGITGMRPDFISRFIFNFVPPMPKGLRKTQKSLDAQFEDDLPKIFRALMALMVKALIIKESINVGDLRLADMVQLGQAIHKALGDPRSFEDLLRENQLAASVTQMEGLPFIEELIALVHVRGNPLKITPHDLLIMVNRFNRSRVGGYGFTHVRNWPGSDVMVGKQLRASIDAMEMRGVSMTLPTSTGKREYGFKLNENRDESLRIGSDPHAGEYRDLSYIELPSDEGSFSAEHDLTDEENAWIDGQLRRLGPNPSDEVFFAEYQRLLKAIRSSDNVIPFARYTG